MAARRRINPTPLPPVPPLSGPNACDPAAMTRQDRLAEVARILARGVARFVLAHRRRPGRGKTMLSAASK